MAIKKYADGSTYDTETGVVINAAGDKYEPKVSNTNPTSYSSLLDTSKLDSSSLKNDTIIPYNTPSESNIYPVGSLNQDISDSYKLTPEQEETDTLSRRITEMNERLLGRSQYTAEQEKIQGIEEKTKTISDLSAQLKTLQNEAQAIPLRLQEEARGRGITAGGLAPIEASRLRRNAIQALTTSSLLEAARGNLTTAQTLVDRAVSQKYDPIKEEIEVAKANLDIILKSPSYTLAEKKQAQSQLEAQEAKKQEVAKQEENDKAILGVATEAAKNGAGSLVLKKIRDAKTVEEALQTAAENGVYTSEEERKMALDGYRKLKPNELSNYTEEQIVRMPNGDIYLKPETQSDATVQAYVNQIKSGRIKLTNVPANIRNDVAVALNSGGYSGGGTGTSPKVNPTKDPISAGYKEGDVFEYNNRFYVVKADGTTRTATAEERSSVTGELNTEEKKFESDLNAELNKLSKGGDWGSSWNYLMNKYGSQGLDNDTLDELLNKAKYYPR